MKDIIILKKVRKTEKLSKSITDITASAEVVQVLSLVDFVQRYKWAMSNADLDTAKELRLTRVKKYLRYSGQVEMELD